MNEAHSGSPGPRSLPTDGHSVARSRGPTGSSALDANATGCPRCASPHARRAARDNRLVIPRRCAVRMIHDPRRRSAEESPGDYRSEEHTSELQSHSDLVFRLLLEIKKIIISTKYE